MFVLMLSIWRGNACAIFEGGGVFGVKERTRMVVFFEEVVEKLCGVVGILR